MSDTQRKKIIIDSIKGLSPSDIKTIFDKVKVKSVIEGKMCLETEEILANIYGVTCKNKSEESYVMFLSSHGIPQTEISKRTGMSLRKVKSYLSDIKQ